MQSQRFPNTPLTRLRLFFHFFDARWEDITRQNWPKTLYQDFSAGLIVAMTAIPMAMGFAMAMGMRPEHGIIAGAVACLVGRTFGGSKYQVYGPTAAFIPIIASLIAKYGPAGGGRFEDAHGFLVLVSGIAGAILVLMGVFGVGKYARLVPNSIIVGFTVGIAVSIALTNILNNACKYSDNGHVTISIASSDQHILVSVRDNGIGIPESEMQFIYDPFFRASNTKRYEGYGIGLPLCKNILTIHKGNILVTSRLNQGTTVEIKLPLASNPTAPVRPDRS
jgi:hypothetical protein